MSGRISVTSIAVVALAQEALACVCMTPTPKDAFKGSGAVFVGQVLSYDGHVAMVQALEVFKGDVPSVSRVYTSDDGGICGYGSVLNVGSTHLFYTGQIKDGGVGVSSCGRTKPIERATCDLRLLRRRAWWWRSHVSSFRPAKWLHLFWPVCAGANAA